MTICSFDTHIFITKSGTLYVSQTFIKKKIIAENVIFHNLLMS